MVQTFPVCVWVCLSAHVQHVNRSTPPYPHPPTVPPCPSCVMYFRQIYPDFPNITENVSLPHLCKTPGYYTIQRKKSKLLATAGREGGVFVVCCIIECGKIKNSNYQQAYMLWGKWLNKKLSLVGDMTAELVFDSGNWSQNDATWEKNNPGLLY